MIAVDLIRRIREMFGDADELDSEPPFEVEETEDLESWMAQRI